MKKAFLTGLCITAICCTNELPYDISDAPVIPVLTAIWSTDETDHLVYLSGSEAYDISAIRDTAEIDCLINGTISATADSLWSVETKDGSVSQCYRIRAILHHGDSVCLSVSLAKHRLKALAVVPHTPKIQIDSTSCYDTLNGVIPYRNYDLKCTVVDTTGISYYRLYTPSVRAEAWLQKAGIMTAVRNWSATPEIDDSDPIFKNVSINFPEMLSRDMVFIHAGLSNITHVFANDSFKNGAHDFLFKLYMHDYIGFTSSHAVFIPDFYIENPELLNEYIPYYNWLKYYVNFCVASITEEEYIYLLAYNAAAVARLDPLSEPVALPSNVEGGLGYFAVEGIQRVSLPLQDCKYPPHINSEDPPV